jgi:hypothetical protein
MKQATFDIGIVAAGRPAVDSDGDDDSYSSGDGEEPAASQDSAERRQREAENRLRSWEEKQRRGGSSKASSSLPLPSALSALGASENAAATAASFLDPEATRPTAAAVVAAARAEQASWSRSRSRSPPPKRPRDLASLAPKLRADAVIVAREETAAAAPNPNQIGLQPPAAALPRKSAAALAREKQKRVADAGVRASGAWKSEEEMVLRQQIDS